MNETSIRLWFEQLRNNINNRGLNDMMEDPTRIFNCDECNLQLSPSTGKVVAIRGKKNVYEVSPRHDKSALTFVGTFSADGKVVKPTIIYPYVRIPRDILNSVPDSITVSKTESGWMNSQAFLNT